MLMPAGRGRRCLLLTINLLLAGVLAQGRTLLNTTDSGAASCPHGRASIDGSQADEWDCITLKDVCIDQGRFIVDSDTLRPGRTFWSDQLFDHSQDPGGTYKTGPGPFYNMPGYMDNFRGAKKRYRSPFFRSPSTQEQADIQAPSYDECSVPLIWWPWWPFDPSDFYLASVAPLVSMQEAGFIDRNVRFMPVLDGQEPEAFVSWMLEPFTNYEVKTVEEVSDRSNAGARCFRQAMMCRPWSVWHWKPGAHWMDGLSFGSVGQRIVEHIRPRLTDQPSGGGVFRVGWLQRHNSSVIKDFDNAVSQCSTWQAPPDSGYNSVHCMALDLDDADKYIDNLSRLQTLDVLIGMHTPGLIAHNFMRPNTSFVEVVPCAFGEDLPEHYYQLPARKENLQFAFRITAWNEAYCWPSRWERADRRPDLSSEDWVASSLKRDQDVTINLSVIQDVLGRIVALRSNQRQYAEVLERNPEYTTLWQ